MGNIKPTTRFSRLKSISSTSDNYVHTTARSVQ